MANLNVTIDTSRMLDGAQFRHASKGVERLYYLLLFSTAPAYTGKVEPWVFWTAQGVNLSVREAPPGAAILDRLRISISPGARRIGLRATGGHKEALEKLRNVLAEIDKIRPSVAELSDSERPAMVMANTAIASALVEPLQKALAQSGIRKEERAALENVLHQALAGLTDREITSMDTAAA